jgi:hypothetical protein
MQLWTWQKPEFDITDPNTPVESKKYSEYLNCDSRKKYEKLWSILGTDQFHWYYADKKEATDSCSLLEYKGKVLWELDVPEDQIFKRMCCMTWHWILNNSNASPPKIFEHFLNMYWWPNRTTFEKDCNKHWRDMSSKQLWDCLFYDCGDKQCYQVLVRHPVDVSWVIKNPLKDINWWQKH